VSFVDDEDLKRTTWKLMKKEKQLKEKTKYTSNETQPRDKTFI